MSRRVVVTGVGLVCGLGIGTDEVWKNLLAGKSGVRSITHFDTTGFDCTIAGEVRDFDPLHWVEKKELKKMGRFIQLALAATDFAVRMADLKVTPDIAELTGVYVASGIGGFDVIEREHSKLLQGGPGRISPFFIPAAIINLASGHISIRYGAKGPNSATATACSASAHAVGDSFRLIQHGYAEVMICGGAEAAITPMGVGGFAAMKALSTRNDEPERASRPFDAQRDGFVIGEGCGHSGAGVAGTRGAARRANSGRGRGLRNVGGRAPHHGAGRERRRRVPRDARHDPRREDRTATNRIRQRAWHFDAAGRCHRDPAMKRVFGENAGKIAVSSTKSMTGHLLGGAGGLEAGISVLALRDQVAAAHDQSGDTGPRVRSRLCAESHAEGRCRICACRIRSVSAEPTPRCCSSAGRPARLSATIREVTR